MLTQFDETSHLLDMLLFTVKVIVASGPRPVRRRCIDAVTGVAGRGDSRAGPEANAPLNRAVESRRAARNKAPVR